MLLTDLFDIGTAWSEKTGWIIYDKAGKQPKVEVTVKDERRRPNPLYDHDEADEWWREYLDE